MLPEQVDECFKKYKEYAARCEFLQHEIHEMKLLSETMRQNAIADAVSISSPNLTGMPHGHSVSNPTENVAIKFADGYVPEHIVQIEQEIREKESEYRTKISTVVYVDAWMKVLNARERLAVEGKMINGMFWRDLIIAYKNEFNETYSKFGLRKVIDRGMEKIYRVAK